MSTHSNTWAIVNNNLYDNDDIHHEIKNLFTCCNMLISRFSKCAAKVKCVLFRTDLLLMHVQRGFVETLGLFNSAAYTRGDRRRYRYHKRIKKFFGYPRLHSMTSFT